MSMVNSKILVGYTLAILYMITPLVTILNILPSFGRANISLKKIDSIGLSLAEDDLKAQESDETRFQKLEFKQLTHQYYREKEDLNFTLSIDNLVFKPGELIF